MAQMASTNVPPNQIIGSPGRRNDVHAQNPWSCWAKRTSHAMHRATVGQKEAVDAVPWIVDKHQLRAFKVIRLCGCRYEVEKSTKLAGRARR
jgi:hypothetical protein